MEKIQVTTEGVVEMISDRAKLTAKSGNEYEMQEVVFTDDADESRKYYFKVIGMFCDKLNGINKGDHCRFSWSAGSREWNGRWYTELYLWKCVSLASEPAPEEKAPKTKESTLPPSRDGELPF